MLTRRSEALIAMAERDVADQRTARCGNGGRGRCCVEAPALRPRS
jgi:hypothetical protein